MKYSFHINKVTDHIYLLICEILLLTGNISIVTDLFPIKEFHNKPIYSN